jgi:hypothetical protein
MPFGGSTYRFMPFIPGYGVPNVPNVGPTAPNVGTPSPRTAGIGGALGGLVSMLGGSGGYEVDDDAKRRAAGDAMVAMGMAISQGALTGRYGDAVSAAIGGGRDIYNQSLERSHERGRQSRADARAEELHGLHTEAARHELEKSKWTYEQLMEDDAAMEAALAELGRRVPEKMTGNQRAALNAAIQSKDIKEANRLISEWAHNYGDEEGKMIVEALHARGGLTQQETVDIDERRHDEAMRLRREELGLQRDRYAREDTRQDRHQAQLARGDFEDQRRAWEQGRAQFLESLKDREVRLELARNKKSPVTALREWDAANPRPDRDAIFREYGVEVPGGDEGGAPDDQQREVLGALRKQLGDQAMWAQMQVKFGDRAGAKWQEAFGSPPPAAGGSESPASNTNNEVRQSPTPQTNSAPGPRAPRTPPSSQPSRRGGVIEAATVEQALAVDPDKRRWVDNLRRRGLSDADILERMKDGAEAGSVIYDFFFGEWDRQRARGAQRRTSQ